MHAGDLIAKAAATVVAANADGTEDADFGGDVLAARFEPAMKAFGDHCEHCVVDGAAEAILQCLESGKRNLEPAAGTLWPDRAVEEQIRAWLDHHAAHLQHPSPREP